jgi:hypothetical protein
MEGNSQIVTRNNELYSSISQHEGRKQQCQRGERHTGSPRSNAVVEDTTPDKQSRASAIDVKGGMESERWFVRIDSTGDVFAETTSMQVLSMVSLSLSLSLSPFSFFLKNTTLFTLCMLSKEACL